MRKEWLDRLADWRKRLESGNADDPLKLYKTVKTLEVKAAEDGSRTVSFTISTASEDRDGDTIAVSGWHLEDYVKNPVVLWQHDPYPGPIGRALYTGVQGDALKSTAEFVPPEIPLIGPLAECAYQLLKAGFMKATSVGFVPIKWAFNEERGGGGWFAPIDFLEQTLLEYSIVSIPSNADALIDAKHKGINVAPWEQWAEHELSTWSPEKGLYLPKGELEGALLALKGRTYQGAKTNNNPPEPKDADAGVTKDGPMGKFLEQIERLGLDSDALAAIRGVALVAEAEMDAAQEKSGRALSKTNQGHIADAMQMCGDAMSHGVCKDARANIKGAQGHLQSVLDSIKADTDDEQEAGAAPSVTKKPMDGGVDADDTEDEPGGAQDGGDIDNVGNQLDATDPDDDDDGDADNAEAGLHAGKGIVFTLSEPDPESEEKDAISIDSEELSEAIGAAVRQSMTALTGRID